jgi:Spy/CpxP family protein refolding chaperone
MSVLALTPESSPCPNSSRRARGWRWSLLALALLLSTVSVTAAADQGGPGMRFGAHMHGGPGQRLHRMLQAAGASDAQKAQIKATWENLRPQLRAVHQDHQKLRETMQQAFAAPTIDPANIEKLRRESVQLMDRRSALITQGMMAAAQVLTPEQRQKVLEAMRNHASPGHQGPGEAP